uniref:Uncharacterized protein n=1 Tax=Pararge aegeria TaxID=116150 RepID=S4P7B0_9NEOP
MLETCFKTRKPRYLRGDQVCTRVPCFVDVYRSRIKSMIFLIIIFLFIVRHYIIIIMYLDVKVILVVIVQ